MASADEWSEKYDYARICENVREMTDWQVLALSAACAEKVFPVVQYLAPLRLRTIAASALDCMWAALQEEHSDHSAADLLLEITNFSECNCEDSDTIQSLVCSCLSFFGWGLEAMTPGSSDGEGERVGFSHMLTVSEWFDLAGKTYPFFENVAVLDAEKLSQTRLVRVVGEDLPRKELIAVIRAESAKMAALFASHLPELCFYYLRDIVDH